MPRIITPVVTGAVSISLNYEDARDLATALDQILDTKSPTWVDRTLRDHVPGSTCNEFLKELKKVTG